ncbi:unnamed protein product, partial [Meganyctiphanes norvegica]
MAPKFGTDLELNNIKFTVFQKFRRKSNYTDATLAVEGKFYPVHKLVLSARSEYFSDIFERTHCKSPVIVLKDVPSHDIEVLLDYMYLGEACVSHINNLPSVLKTAECLRIKGLPVLDGDTAKVIKNSATSHDAQRDSPPAKRRRHNSKNLPTHAVFPVPSPQMSARSLVNPSKTHIPSHSSSNTSNSEQNEMPFVAVEKVESDFAEELNTEEDKPRVVKVEIDNTDEHEESFRREYNYERWANIEHDPLENYGPGLTKRDHEPKNYGYTSIPGPSLQQTASESNEKFTGRSNKGPGKKGVNRKK